MTDRRLVAEQEETSVPLEKESLLKEEASKTKTRPAAVSIASTSPNIDQRRRSSVAPGAQFHIYWRSVVTMILAFLLGLGSALALHGYYSSLNGKIVGDTDQQQTALRIGTTLAFITQISFATSINYAYVQALWKALKRSIISINGIDAGFAASESLLSFLDLEMLAKLRLASFLALVAWCIPISSLITPATLNVDSVLQQSSQMMNVPALDISQSTVAQDFAFYVSRSATLQKYLRPRTILTRLAVATSTTGQILPLVPPAINATYEQSFLGPYVQCQDANQSIINQIDAANQRRKAALDSSIKELANDYFAFVPALSNMNDLSPNATVQIANLTDVNGALYASNQLWLNFPRYNANDISFNVSNVPNPHYLMCELHNASYHVNFTWNNGTQLLDILSLDVLDATPYPVNPSYSASDEDNMAYSAYMWAISSQLTGTMGFYQDVSTNDTNNQIIANRTYSEIATNIDETSLLGTSDLNSYFIQNHFLTNQNASELFSSQRLQDMALARNRTLDALIPELSLNTTLSLISNPLLSPLQSTNVTITTPANIYVYQPKNVFISYGIAIFFSLLANIAGLFAFFSNGVSYEISFSAIVCTTRDIHFSGLNAHERIGALPLDKKVGRTKMKFDVGDVAEMERGERRWGFGKA